MSVRRSLEVNTINHSWKSVTASIPKDTTVQSWDNDKTFLTGHAIGWNHHVKINDGKVIFWKWAQFCKYKIQISYANTSPKYPCCVLLPEQGPGKYWRVLPEDSKEMRERGRMEFLLTALVSLAGQIQNRALKGGVWGVEMKGITVSN